MMGMVTAEMIHTEIDEAQDRLLRAATASLADNSKMPAISKSERLTRLGFTSAVGVTDASKMTRTLEDDRNLASNICRYSTRYPFHKFITESEMDRICKKYGLIYSSASTYIGDVPEKNLADIESAPDLLPDDCPVNLYTYSFRYISDIPKPVRNFFNGRMFDHRMCTEREFRQACPIPYRGYLYMSYTETTIDRGGLFIAAPPTMFKLGRTHKLGLGHFFTSTHTVKDPIVFRYVRGGMQVLTKWGAESDDQPLTVPTLN